MCLESAIRAGPRGVVVALVLAAGLCGGCVGSTRVVTAPAPREDVTARRTFTFLPDDPAPADDRGGLPAALRGAVRRELTAKGYVPSSSGRGELLVSCVVNVTEPPNPRALNYSDTRWRAEHGAPEDAGVPGPQEPWEIGAFDVPGGYMGMAVVVDVIDAATGELAWRGWARRAVAPREIGLDEIADVTRAVLERFPARARNR